MDGNGYTASKSPSLYRVPLIIQFQAESTSHHRSKLYCKCCSRLLFNCINSCTELSTNVVFN